ncbi:MAG: ABC transporter permease [Lachnospiraceae bacterium]|nr:ABC transporter permease [Lachnospiraceae bacterium]
MSTEATGRKLNENEKKKIDFSSWTIIYLTLILFVFLSLTRSTFLNYNNIHSIFFDVAVDFWAIVGFTFLIIMGELDMSVGSMFCFGGTLMGIFCNSYGMSAGWAILLAVIIGGVIGSISGFLITKFRLNSMMVTIGVMLAVKGYNWMMITKMTGRQLPRESRNFVMVRMGGVSWVIILMLAVVVILEVLLNKSKYFKQMYYIGHNMETTILYGIKSNKVKTICFAVSAMLATFGGALMTCRVKAPNVTVGSNLEVTMITAAIVGGASIFGGRGSIAKSMLGLLFIYILRSGMTAYHIDSYVQQIILGLILIGAIIIDIRISRKKA